MSLTDKCDYSPHFLWFYSEYIGVMMKNNCVYFLIDCNDIVRYIGRGSLKRAKEVNHLSRSLSFKEIYKNNGRLDVVHSDLSKSESMDIEHTYLKDYFEGKYPTWNLINKTKGGKELEIVYKDLSKLLKLDFESPTYLVWDYDKVKSNNQLCSKARVGFIAGCLIKNVNPAKNAANLAMNGKTYPIYRVVWSLFHKKDLSSDMVINHIDGDRLNNHPENLEAVSQKINIHKKTRKGCLANLGVTGIRLSSNNGEKDAKVTAYYSDKNCKQHSSNFSTRKYGLYGAIELALDYRKTNMIREYGEDFQNPEPKEVLLSKIRAILVCKGDTNDRKE